MAVQQQMASFARGTGGAIAAAHAEHAGKPIDTGNRRLPPGIRNGIAKITEAYTKQQDTDNGAVPRGGVFFRIAAVVVSPKEFPGFGKTAGMVTSKVIPICNVPAKGDRKASTLKDNWFTFQNIFKLLGIFPPDEKGTDEAADQRIQAYYFAAMRGLCDEKRPPVYISFSTRGWTPPAKPGQPKPQEIVFEYWHGLADEKQIAEMNGQYNPAAGVTEAGRTAIARTPVQFEEPPVGVVDPQSLPSNGEIHDMSPDADDAPEYEGMDLADEVAALIEVAMDDPEGATDEGAAASKQLEEMAWENGWTAEQTGAAADWAAVGDMALTPADESVVPPPPPVPAGPTTPTVGSKWKFAKRGKDGQKLKNNKGVEFPPHDVEVVALDADTKTCTVKTVKDGNTVVDIRTKTPIPVKWEWLE